MTKRTEILKCHFCGLTDRQAQHMIKGPEANICAQCVLLCLDAITEDDEFIDNKLKTNSIKDNHDAYSAGRKARFDDELKSSMSYANSELEKWWLLGWDDVNNEVNNEN